MIIKAPFENYRLPEEKVNDRYETLSLKLNKEEREWLNRSKLTLNQPKDSTAIKTLAKLGELVIHDEKNALMISVILKNLKLNERTGAQVEIEPS